MPFMVRANKTNNTLKYIKDNKYVAHISQVDRTILFIENEEGDKVVVNAIDFKGEKEDK